MSLNQPNLLLDPKLDYPIHDLHLNFHDYIKECKKIIIKGRIDLATDDEIIIDANAPFEFRPTTDKKIKYGALLIHGLFDSPFMMRDIGKQLCAQGLLVRCILLPGHGTVPGGLLNVDYHQWLQAVNYGAATLANEVEQIFLVGFSTGASLALHHAAQHPSIAGIIMMSPALKILSTFASVSNWPRKLGPLWPRANWFCIRKEIDYAKYQSIAFNAVYQLYLLTKEINQINPHSWTHCPMFFALSAQDEVISSQANIKFFHRINHVKNRMIWYTNSNKPSPDKRIIMRNSVYPDMGIESFSHITIPIMPTNYHYGETGDYCDASHIDAKKFIYCAYNPGRAAFDKFLYQHKLIPRLHRRLTFNPDFEFLTSSMQQFIETV